MSRPRRAPGSRAARAPPKGSSTGAGRSSELSLPPAGGGEATGLGRATTSTSPPAATRALRHHGRVMSGDPPVLRNYVGGAWVESGSGELLDVTEPASGTILARVPLSGAADLDAAVEAARAALPA